MPLSLQRMARRSWQVRSARRPSKNSLQGKSWPLEFCRPWRLQQLLLLCFLFLVRSHLQPHALLLQQTHIEGSNAVFQVRHYSVTVANDKLLRHLHEQAEIPDGPQAISVVEMHLRGAELNKMWRSFKKAGWRSFTTRAIPKAQQAINAGEAQPSDQ